MEFEKYLERFNASHDNIPSLQQLSELQRLHMTKIPFENLDVIRSVPIYLNLNTIYDKIVLRNRGGYCYELNGLFHWLLRQLGYDASLVSATVYRPNGQWAKPETHAAIIVQLDEPYLVDVGFGDSTILPIPLNGSPQTDVSGTYAVQQSSKDVFDLIRTRNGDSRPLYRFTTIEKQLSDFHEGCVFNQVSPESTFTHVDIVTKATPTGRTTLRDFELTVSDNGVISSKTITEDAKEAILMDLFGINVRKCK
ncbi:arylamine N-acetyltransferase family protein [Sporosarcina luteola]|uniref:arylamine N-acetyltransferase family protein n=1 Tax=Sporosarcina luteola TaxID=582850 RepID=UPI00203AB4DE|nr:arylamine N-acetyltransferase [Sporosarcina luteola]MCM3711382.1 arylamine N-acetyltransferase [Sporosarcina luteola]